MNILKKPFDSGLDLETLQTIERILQTIPGISEAVLFGSRAMGNYKPASDIDIALKGEDSDKAVSSVKSLLENAPRFPYIVDIVSYESISTREFKQHIDTHGVLLFKDHSLKI